MKKKKQHPEIRFWKGVLIRGIVIFGYSFFALLVSKDLSIAFIPSLIAGGLYIFTEAIRHYKLQTPTINKKTEFQFFIHP